MSKSILVIGGGASGMVAAIIAARQGKAVTILEQKNELGKKILATGNGRCNFTNVSMGVEDFYCQDNNTLRNVLNTYTTDVILEFFQSIGILAKERSGYYYPITDQASNIRDALLAELKELGVIIYLECEVRRIQYSGKWNVYTSIHDFNADTIILATGGKSGLPKQTSSDGFALIKNTSHTLTTLSPALVPLKGKGKFFKKLAGIRTDVSVTALINHKPIRTEIGEIQLTDYGVSGIPIFQISRILTQELFKTQKEDNSDLAVEIDFMPNYNIDDLINLFINRKKLLIGRTMDSFLLGVMKDKLASFLLYTARIDNSTLVSDIDNSALEKLARICKTFKVQIDGSKDFLQSQVTAGGVCLTEVSEELESIYHPHLYFTGEVLDVDGICGGYNLHFAWASGMLVGNAVSK